MSENHFTEIRANQICFDKPVYVVNGIVFGHFTKTFLKRKFKRTSPVGKLCKLWSGIVKNK